MMTKSLRLAFNCLVVLAALTAKVLASSDTDAKIDELVERIARLEERDNAFVESVARLEERDQQQQHEIKDLRAELLSQKQRTVTLEKFVRTLSKHRKDEANFVNTDELSNAPNTSYGAGKRSVEHHANNRIRRTEENEMDVAFFATLSKHQMNVGVNQPIIFDRVVTNIGDSYHNHLGSFIAPVSGTYVFSVSLLSWTQTVDYTISKNGIAVSQISTHSATSVYEHSSQTVVLQLVKNDDINIRNKYLDRNTHGENYSTFAGFMLKQQLSDVIIG